MGFYRAHGTLGFMSPTFGAAQINHQWWTNGIGLTVAWGLRPREEVRQSESKWRHTKEFTLVSLEEIEDYGLWWALSPIRPLWRWDDEGKRHLQAIEFCWGFGLRKRCYQWRIG